MKFEYQLTRKDLGDYNAHYYWKNRIGSAITGAICMIIITFLLISNQEKVNLPAAAICLTIGVLVYFALIQRQLKKYGKQFKENGPMLAKKQIELTDEYYISSDMYEETRVKWNAFSKVETGKHAIYLFMESPMAMIIPKSIFATDTEMNDFIDYVKSRLKSAIIKTA